MSLALKRNSPNNISLSEQFSMNPSNDKSPSQPPLMQMVLLAEPISFNASELEESLRAKTGNPGLSVIDGEEGEDSFVVQWGNRTFAVLHIDKPAPIATFDTAVRTTPGLKNGPDIVANHKAHLIVSPLSSGSGPGAAILNGMGVMTLTDMLLEGRGIALGFFWNSAETLIDAAQYKQALAKADQAMAKQASKQPNAGYDLPATYWVGYRLFKAKQPELVGATTKGFSMYFGFEIELTPDRRQPAEIAAKLYSIVSYVFANGPVLKDGETIEVRPGEVFRIFHQSANAPLSERFILKRVVQTQ